MDGILSGLDALSIHQSTLLAIEPLGAAFSLTESPSWATMPGLFPLTPFV
jgi:hypothetical protein